LERRKQNLTTKRDTLYSAEGQIESNQADLLSLSGRMSLLCLGTKRAIGFGLHELFPVFVGVRNMHNKPDVLNGIL
jgi:hypothetical protein